MPSLQLAPELAEQQEDGEDPLLEGTLRPEPVGDRQHVVEPETCPPVLAGGLRRQAAQLGCAHAERAHRLLEEALRRIAGRRSSRLAQESLETRRGMLDNARHG